MSNENEQKERLLVEKIMLDFARQDITKRDAIRFFVLEAIARGDLRGARAQTAAVLVTR